MGKAGALFALLVFFLVFAEPAHPASTASLTDANVRSLIIDSAALADVIDGQISYLSGVAAQIQPCPCPEEGTDACSDAAAQANAALSLLHAKNDAAKSVIKSAASDYNSPLVSLSDVVNKIGTALAVINSGINDAIIQSDSIPESCPDDNNNDICPSAKAAATHSLATVAGDYQAVKAEYDGLAGLKPQLTPEQIAENNKNDRLLGVYSAVAQGQRTRETIADLENSGASEQEIAAAKMTLAGQEQKAEDVYKSVLLDKSYEHDFWTNWDYATLKKNQGDNEMAMRLYINALSDPHVSEATKQAFISKVMQDSQQELNLKAPPSTASKVMGAISEGVQSVYESVQQYGSSKFNDAKIAFMAKMAKAGKVYNDVQKFEEDITGKGLSNAAQEAAK
jgi:hypothetical protein